MTERELAIKVINDIKSLTKVNSLEAMPLDKKEYFESEYNLEVFTKECENLGYEVVPLEKSIISMFPLKDKVVVQEKRHLNKNLSNIKIGRNEPCHCGSGKKYKFCCGK